MGAPDPDVIFPLAATQEVAFLAPLAVDRPNTEIGAYTYYHDRSDPTRFFDRNVLYHFDFIGDKLIIGPFCAIAEGARFVMNGGGHAMGGFSTFPFNIFGHGWENGFDPATWIASQKGDTRIGADVWIGAGATIMPGVTIGPGAIIGTGALVARDVPPFAIVTGNPAEISRKRFDDPVIDALLALAWWDWPVDKISANLDAIRGADLKQLEAES